MATLKNIQRSIILRRTPASPTATQQPADNVRLWNLATDALLLDSGFASAYSEVPGSSDPITNLTPLAGDEIQFIAHRDMSRLKGTLSIREWERTGLINPNSACGVDIAYQAPTMGITETHLLNASALVPLEVFTYRVVTRAKGDIIDLYNGTKSSTSGKSVNYTSPDFTTLNITNVIAQRDNVLANVAQRFNRMNNPTGNYHLAICLGASAVTGSVLVSSITVGQRIILGYQLGGIPDYLTISQSMKDAFVAAAANALVTAANSGVSLGAMHIIPYHISGTTLAPAVPISGLQGAAVRASRIMFVCLDAVRPYYEERPDFKTGMELGLTDGWIGSLATQFKMTSMQDTIGDSNKVRLAYREQAYRENPEGAGRPFEAMHVEYQNELVNGGMYDQFIVTWCSGTTGNTGLVGQHHKLVNIFIPNYTIGNAVTNAFFSGVANPALAYFDGILQTFNDVNGLRNGNIVP